VPSYFTIGLGYWDRQQTNSWSVLKTVTRIIIHPSYDSSTTTNDIALMKLDVKVIFSYYSKFSVFPLKNSKARTVPYLKLRPFLAF
jgi:hypothetical protein